jgi:hypothetical protein
MTTPLHGHTSAETAYLVADYPYGRKVRCRIRYWLESDPKRGFRFVSQTEHPTRKVWNAPKKSTYMLLAACMFLDEVGHVQWAGLSEYDDHARVRAFIDRFPGADLSSLRPWCLQKAAFYKAYAKRDADVWTVNGKEDRRPVFPAETERRVADAEAWTALFRSLPAPPK